MVWEREIRLGTAEWNDLWGAQKKEHGKSYQRVSSARFFLYFFHWISTNTFSYVTQKWFLVLVRIAHLLDFESLTLHTLTFLCNYMNVEYPKWFLVMGVRDKLSIKACRAWTSSRRWNSQWTMTAKPATFILSSHRFSFLALRKPCAVFSV